MVEVGWRRPWRNHSPNSSLLRQQKLKKQSKTRSLHSAPFIAPLSSLPNTSPPNTPTPKTAATDNNSTPPLLNTPPPNSHQHSTFPKKQKQKNSIPGGKVLSSRQAGPCTGPLVPEIKALLRPLFKISSVDGRSMNFPKVAVVITWIRNMGGTCEYGITKGRLFGDQNGRKRDA